MESVFFKRLSDKVIRSLTNEPIILITFSIARKVASIFIAQLIIAIVRFYPFCIIPNDIYMFINLLHIDLEGGIEIPWFLSCAKRLQSLFAFPFTLSPFILPFLQFLGIHLVNRPLLFFLCCLLFCNSCIVNFFFNIITTMGTAKLQFQYLLG